MRNRKLPEYRNILLLAAILILCAFGNYAYSRELQCFEGLTEDELHKDVWTLCGRADLSGRGAGLFISDSLYVENLPDREDFFIIRGDSLLWTGYHIGRRIGILAESPVFVFNRKNLTTDSATVAFSAKGRLDVTTIMQEQTTMQWSLSGRGKVVITPADTLHNIILTKQVWHTTPVWNDSVAESEAVERVVYRWYTPEMGMPVAVQRDGELFVDTDYAEYLSTDENDADGDNLEWIQSIIDSAIVSYDNDKVVVTTDAYISLNVYIMDVAGNIYASVSGYATEFELSTASLSSGQYIISIVSAPEPVYDRKILYRK